MRGGIGGREAIPGGRGAMRGGMGAVWGPAERCGAILGGRGAMRDGMGGREMITGGRGAIPGGRGAMRGGMGGRGAMRGDPWEPRDDAEVLYTASTSCINIGNPSFADRASDYDSNVLAGLLREFQKAVTERRRLQLPGHGSEVFTIKVRGWSSQTRAAFPHGLCCCTRLFSNTQTARPC
jgi:hypothetical protein